MLYLPRADLSIELKAFLFKRPVTSSWRARYFQSVVSFSSFSFFLNIEGLSAFSLFSSFTTGLDSALISFLASSSFFFSSSFCFKNSSNSSLSSFLMKGSLSKGILSLILLNGLKDFFSLELICSFKASISSCCWRRSFSFLLILLLCRAEN